MSIDQQSQAQQEQHLGIKNVSVVFPVRAIDVIQTNLGERLAEEG